MEPHRSLRATLAGWVRDISPSCRDVSQLQSRALDESLPWRVRFGLKTHLLLCRWCRRYGRQIRFLREALRSQGGELPDGSDVKLPDEARTRFKQRLRQE